ncbi:MAG TPA: metallophosphoesterase family protein [Chitinophagaceae bacterium]|nr:metallophosphoesterase family protein [Chitinophagaceae bacterium]
MNEEKIITHLGKIEGKLLFFGGVYSNLQALQSLKKWAEENNFLPQNIFCTGDILGYCAQPLECISLVKDWGIHSIAGNVESQVRNNEVDCGCEFESGGRCDLFSKNWYSYIQSKMDLPSKIWLNTLPHHIQFNYGKDKLTIVHGSWFHTSEFIFNSTEWSVKKNNFDGSDSTIIIAGHCGLPFIHQLEQYSWLNPGVIGMPANDGTSKVWFATAEIKDEKFTCQFHHLEYDYKTAKKLMIENKLPISYAETLETGIWDNCEILPIEETKMQGEKIGL